MMNKNDKPINEEANQNNVMFIDEQQVEENDVMLIDEQQVEQDNVMLIDEQQVDQNDKSIDKEQNDVTSMISKCIHSFKLKTIFLMYIYMNL